MHAIRIKLYLYRVGNSTPQISNMKVCHLKQTSIEIFSEGLKKYFVEKQVYEKKKVLLENCFKNMLSNIYTDYVRVCMIGISCE